MENRYDATLKTLTPLSIGDGSRTYPFEYWTEGNMVFVGNFEKLVDALSDNLDINYQKLVEMINRNADFLQILAEFGLQQSKKNFILKTIEANETFYIEIENFIAHPNGKRYIPGSSVKGAMLTGLIAETIDLEKVQTLYSNKHLELPKNWIDSENNVFVSDAEKGNIKPKVYRINRIGMSISRTRGAYGTYRESDISRRSELGAVECIEGQLDITIKTRLRKSDLIKVVNNFYSNSIKEIERIAAVRDSAKLMENLANIESAFRDDCIIIQLGHYGNYFTKSLGAAIKRFATGSLDDEGLGELRKNMRFGKIPGMRGREKEYNAEFPKTFPITSGNMPLGWVSIEF